MFQVCKLIVSKNGVEGVFQVQELSRCWIKYKNFHILEDKNTKLFLYLKRRFFRSFMVYIFYSSIYLFNLTTTLSFRMERKNFNAAFLGTTAIVRYPFMCIVMWMLDLAANIRYKDLPELHCNFLGCRSNSCMYTAYVR